MTERLEIPSHKHHMNKTQQHTHAKCVLHKWKRQAGAMMLTQKDHHGSGWGFKPQICPRSPAVFSVPITCCVSPHHPRQFFVLGQGLRKLSGCPPRLSHSTESSSWVDTTEASEETLYQLSCVSNTPRGAYWDMVIPGSVGSMMIGSCSVVP